MESGQEIIKQVGMLSYFGIFGLSFLANVVVPVPEEVLILAIGYVSGLGKINFWITMIAVILGSFISDVIMFLLSRKNNKLVTGFYNKVFIKIFPIDQDFLKKHSEKVIFLSRFLVQLRFLGPFIAGQVQTSWKKFILWDLLALFVYVPILMWAGHYFSKNITSIFEGVNSFKNGILLLVVVMVIWSSGQFAKKKFLEFRGK